MDNVKVAVIGSGLMGGGIAQACAQAGFTVVNIDIAQAPLDKAQALVAKLLQKKVDKNKMSAEDRQAILDRLTYSTDYAELAGAKFIIEAVPERLDFKQSTFQKMDEFADEDAVLLTNTSGISIDEIAASTKRPESVLGLHFFYPAPVMKLVEIIRGEKTSDEAFAKGCEKYSFAKPFTKESLLYRDIFEKYYPGQAEMVKDFWMPNKSWKGCDVQDPSARVLSNYGASGV